MFVHPSEAFLGLIIQPCRAFQQMPSDSDQQLPPDRLSFHRWRAGSPSSERSQPTPARQVRRDEGAGGERRGRQERLRWRWELMRPADVDPMETAGLLGRLSLFIVCAGTHVLHLTRHSSSQRSSSSCTESPGNVPGFSITRLKTNTRFPPCGVT